jgi:hypothetical protein
VLYYIISFNKSISIFLSKKKKKTVSFEGCASMAVVALDWFKVIFNKSGRSRIKKYSIQPKDGGRKKKKNLGWANCKKKNF